MIRFPLFAGMAVLLCAAGAAIPTGPVTLVSQPGTPLDAVARDVAAQDVRDGGAGALLLLGSQRLGRAVPGSALFVQVQSERACGSAGCSTSVYLPEKRGWRRVLDAVSGNIVVQPSEHQGMHDLLVGKNDRWVWNGAVYADTLPAPQVDLRPRHSHHQAGRRGATRTPSPARP